MGIQKKFIAMGFMQQSNTEWKLALNSDYQQVYSIPYLLISYLNVESKEPTLFIEKYTLTHHSNEAPQFKKLNPTSLSTTEAISLKRFPELSSLSDCGIAEEINSPNNDLKVIIVLQSIWQKDSMSVARST